MRNKMNKSIKVCCSWVFFSGKSRYSRRSWLAGMVAVFLALIAVPLSAEEQNNPDEVGQVTLVIGQALAHNKKGEQRPLKRGDSVYVDETIETSAGGHVHLRFVDEGTVSLRPNSRLSIELYHYDKQQPKNSAIRFNLEAGVVRSISGKATQAAHDRFRLNTPITAIGVLGTDFVVRAEPEKMWAGVYSGAIAIAPLNEQCSVNGLGACAGATRLSEAMGSVMIEFSGRKEKEKIVPLDPAIISKANHSGDNKSEQSADAPATGSGRINAAEIKGADVAVVATHLVGTQQPGQQPNQFFWAHYGKQLPGDAMTVPSSEAQARGAAVVSTRGETGAGLGYFALFQESKTLALAPLPTTGAYDFKLEGGEVYFKGNDAVSRLAQLNEATMRIDFGRSMIDAHLKMSAPETGAFGSIDISGNSFNGAEGIIRAEGANNSYVNVVPDGATAHTLFGTNANDGKGSFFGAADFKK